ncbi:12433_t:CDS:2 [Funneliformis geosporum]|uniref:9481_t:CDS:1 n=1 Tax=Funneliformis geosporum TaxID=1117311 RepID=A0A9W4WI69_9GLOM|nr:9481_t:CDS:2 [Funneliformis geosporum]CAI2164370.1 12433_t:CDS:2 [Funneliformis geosporum]
MEQSFNCCILLSNTSGTFTFGNLSVDIFNNNNNKFVDFVDKKISLNKFKVVHIRDQICRIKNVAISDNMKLWKLNDIKYRDIHGQNISTNEDVVQKLHGIEMELHELFEEYFRDEIDNPNFAVSNIHIITIIPTTGQLVGISKSVGSLEETLSVILQNIPTEKIKTSNKTIKIPEKMPLKERDINESLMVFNSNVNNSFDPTTSKSNFDFLVCSGAAGIGKTRWGKEFFNSIERDWKPPSKPQDWEDNLWSWKEPHFLYLFLDFVNGVRLSDLDVNQSASIILGLRIAYDYFARDKMSFEAFQFQALYFIDRFRINCVLSWIQESLNLRPEQKLIIILHIDEYQEIFTFEDNWKAGLTDKGLFKEILYALGPLMIDSNIKYYVQTFLSGTVTRDVTKNFKPTEYSFKFVQCPLLSTKSIIEIVDYFAKQVDKEGYWMSNTKFLQLLYDTGGLPRALETVLEECYKRESFFLKLKDKNFTLFNDMFHAIINSLTKKYKLDKFIGNNHKASYQLLYYCIGAIPVQLDTIISKVPMVLTIENMERDGFLILTSDGPNYLIEMPFYFIYIYNTWLNIIPATIHKTFQPDSKMAWDTWEIFVANYEIFRNNLLVELEHYKEIPLRKFYRGAIGKDSVLNIWIRLEKLDLCDAKNQFPKTGLPINRSNNEVMKLDGLVFINGHSAKFADVFLVRKTVPENKNLIIGFQQKWYTTSKELTIDDIKDECNKNNNAFKHTKDRDLKKFLKKSIIVTVIFTSRPFKANPKDLPNNCLVISKENFKQYFGPLFSSRLTFDIINNLNINSAEPKRIAEAINGIGEILSKAIYDNRPYKSVNDLIEKNLTYKEQLENARTQLENCSYAPYSFFLDNEHDLMMLDECDSYSNYNISDIDMEVDL